MAELGEANIGGRMVPAWLLNLTAEELDSLKSRWHSNPNLLDNWYFSNPVDQRGGYVVPPNVDYNELGWNGKVGTTDKYYPVKRWEQYSNLDAIIEVNGVEYVVAGPLAVRGYIIVGYGIDRWLIGAGSNGTLLLTESGLNLARTDGIVYLAHRIPKTQIPEGSLLTYSVLTTSGLFSINFIAKNDTYHEQVVGGGISLGWNYSSAEIMELTLVNNTANSNVTVKAAKLELGSQQTLARQDANGNWVLNEVPAYWEQLARCLRHDYIIGRKDDAAPVGLGTAYDDTSVVAVIELPEMMRANPIVSITGFVNLRFSASKNISVSSVKNYGFSGDKVQLFFDGLSGLTQGQSCDIYVSQGSKIEFNSNL